MGGAALPTVDKTSFVAAIAVQYGRRLRRFLSVRLRKVQDVPELAQEVFLRLIRVDKHEAIRNPEAYLFTVASHVIHQHALRRTQSPSRKSTQTDGSRC
jgi:RNA polymerase sigma-70 factor (ECF subfamily)